VEQLKGSQLLSGLIYCNPFDGGCSPLRWRCDHQLLRGPRGPLAETFGVHPSYLSDRGSKPLIIDQEAMGIFRDETGSAIKITIAFIYTSERDR
jgi:hypothetical protein